MDSRKFVRTDGSSTCVEHPRLDELIRPCPVQSHCRCLGVSRRSAASESTRCAMFVVPKIGKTGKS